MKFVKIDNFWWRYDDKTSLYDATVYNVNGFGKMSNLDLTNIIVTDAKSWQDLNWKGTEVYDNTFKTGWLSPEGKFFGCKTEYHSLQAHLFHNRAEKQLEKDGFVKITKLRFNDNTTVALFPGRFYNKNLSPTVAQIEYLEKQTGINCSEVFAYFEKAEDELER